MAQDKPWPYAGNVWLNSKGEFVAVLRSNASRNFVVYIQQGRHAATGTDVAAFWSQHERLAAQTCVGVEGVIRDPSFQELHGQLEAIAEDIENAEDRRTLFHDVVASFAGFDTADLNTLDPSEYGEFLMAWHHAVAAYLDEMANVVRLPVALPAPQLPGAA